MPSGLPERPREIVLERDGRQRKLDQIGIGLDAGLALGLLDQGRAHPAADPAAFLAQQTGLLGRLHNRIKPRLADEKRPSPPRADRSSPPCTALRPASCRRLGP